MAPNVPWPGLDDEDLLLAVANTAHGEQDELADAPSTRAWWLGIGSPATTRESRPDVTDSVAMLRALRVLIRGLALRNNGVEPDLSGASGLDALPLRLDLHGTPSLRADVPGDLARDIGAATIAALLRATGRPGWSRVKACRGDDCRWVFIDSSRNASRRWCAMANCGNRAKMATFRDRHRSRPPRAPQSQP
ncbi:CGNR zinc finger domain-containing protein [Actinoplanes sp. NPDC026619]|uniref:CGNR zinc finger domain-containing protein n=1 Tax=Actinoplanes sp. NPDC026619 TaxID=3155798 RepID=UPI0033FFD780